MVQPFPLNHGRCALLSAKFLRGGTWELDLDSWIAAKDALLFNDDLDVSGRSAGHELFIEQLGDKARAPARTW